ncbi:MAG: LemA family protein [Bacilli bacterium]|nr:LemA family protein [Bacilli bacterium]
MLVVMYILFAVVLVGILLIWYANVYNRFQSLIIRINEAEASIDTVLRKRFDLLNKAIGVIKNNITVETEVLDMIVKLRSRKLSNFDLDRQLYLAINEFNAYKESHKELQKCEGFIKIELGINESESEVVALRKYYNDIITDYNELTKIFPCNLVAKISHLNERTYFDGKNMSDNVVNDFKL